MSNPSVDSVYRERLFEHQLIWELMRYAWKHDGAGLEVSQPAIDRSGHELVLEARGVTRHVQLKTSWADGKTRGQNVHLGLVGKPSGCVVWMRVHETDMTCQSFLFFGGAPCEPLPSLDACRVAKHTRKNGNGTKGERPNLRTVPRARFRLVADVAELYATLFAYSMQTGHLFRRKLDSRSSANWTPVPFQTGHLFQTKLDTMSVTARG